jgi:predicted molibdopterin-dependent oxidoreductase YjgC
VPFYAGLSDEEIGGRGVRWQERPAASDLPEVERVMEGAAGTPSRKGRSSLDGAPAVPSTGNGPPLILGTYRDLWAGPVTEHNPALRFLAPTQRLEISPADAERLGLSEGDEVTVSSNGTSLRGRVAIRERAAEGACFLIEGTAEANANALAGEPVAVEVSKA